MVGVFVLYHDLSLKFSIYGLGTNTSIFITPRLHSLNEFRWVKSSISVLSTEDRLRPGNGEVFDVKKTKSILLKVCRIGGIYIKKLRVREHIPECPLGWRLQLPFYNVENFLPVFLSFEDPYIYSVVGHSSLGSNNTPILSLLISLVKVN